MLPGFCSWFALQYSQFQTFNAMWTKVSERKPPENVVIDTKIMDEKGERNLQRLRLRGGFWCDPNVEMYVYYTPTHWKHI